MESRISKLLNKQSTFLFTKSFKPNQLQNKIVSKKEFHNKTRAFHNAQNR